MIAHTSHHLLTSEGVQTVDEYEDNPKQSTANEELVQEKEAFLAFRCTSSPTPPNKGELAKKAYKFFSGLSKIVRSQQVTEPSLVTSLGDDPDNIEGL